jgi:oligopeptide transport system substrate-binding protein
VNEISANSLKYLKVDPVKREAARRAWNKPVIWPALLLLIVLVVSAIPAFLSYRRRERLAARPAG